jgi:predicted branched-subunit amino acid permease
MNSIDALFFIFVEKFKDASQSSFRRQWFYLGASCSMYVSWMLATVIGIIAGNILLSWMGTNINFPMTALFVAMMASCMVDKKSYCIVTTAGICALLANSVPYNLNIIIGTIAGVIASGIYDKFKTQKEGK